MTFKLPNPFEKKPSSAPKQERSWKMPGLLTMGAALSMFLASCSGNEKPSQATIDNYFDKNPTAERVDKQLADSAKASFLSIADYLKEHEVVDLRDSADIISNNERYPDAVFVDEVQLLGDSTIVHTVFTPSRASVAKEMGVTGGIDYRYTLHGDGTLTIQDGYLLQSGGGTINSHIALDTKSGGITNYIESSIGGNPSMRLNKDGVMEYTAGYDQGRPTEKASKGAQDLVDISAKIAKK